MPPTVATAAAPTPETPALDPAVVQRRRKMWLLGGLWLVVVVAGLGLWFGVEWSRPEVILVDLDDALEALVAHDDARAVRIATSFLPWNDLPPRRRWIPPYVLGAVHARRAEPHWDARRRELALLASRYLDAALEFDIPEAWRSRVLVECGRMHLEAGHARRALPSLEAATMLADEQASTAARWLAQAYADGARPNWWAVRAATRLARRDDALQGESRDALTLLEGRALAALGDLPAALKTWSSIGPNSAHRAEGLFLQGLSYWREHTTHTEQAGRRKALESATNLLQQAIESDNWFTDCSMRALLILARAERDLGKHDEALAHFAQLE